MKKLISFLIIGLITFSACQDSDDFSSDNSLRLAFSSDTIRFDTIFTNIGSATKQFSIYNRNDKSLHINSVELVNATESGFRMNIDGLSGTQFTDLEILKKDSLYGFVEVTVDPLNSDLLLRDSIRFVVNGNAQYVQLTAVGKDVHIWRNKVIKSDTTLTGEKPFLVYGTLKVDESATLSIKEGVTFYMYNDAAIDVSGTIEARGAVELPVVFRGSRFDHIERNIPYDNVPGQWAGITFGGGSYNNVLENVLVRNAEKALTFAEADPQYKKAIMKNTVVQNSSDYGMSAINCNIEAINCLFANAKTSVLMLYGGEYSFLHCTVANYYNWSPRQAQSLIISNHSDNGKIYELNKCDFINSIVYGFINQEIQLNRTESSPFNFMFHNCLLKAPEATDANLVNILWNADPLFRNLNDKGDYSYSFELTESSPARGIADASYSISAPEDIKGISRSDNPDAGCYEWKK